MGLIYPNMNQRYFVTGGAGFIGSHIVDHLMDRGDDVVVYDNFCTGQELFIKHHFNNSHFKLIKGDVLDFKALKGAMGGSDFVFHIAGHADVKGGYKDHAIDLEQNFMATRNVLEAMRQLDIKNIAFSSTSSVYGDATVHPTLESYLFKPTSLYGAAKANSENYIYTYAHYYDWNAYIFRFVSWIGERYTHGCIFDFMKRLKTDPSHLHILSDGTPKKSSLYVKDGVSAIFTIIEKSSEKINIYNLGHEETIIIKNIADIVCDELGLKKVHYTFEGGEKGWMGDNKFVHLGIDKLKRLGWKPTVAIEDGIRRTVRYLKGSPFLLDAR